MSKTRIINVTDSSPAYKRGIKAGDEILSVNGSVPRDVLEYNQLTDSDEVEFEVKRKSETLQIKIKRFPGESLGIEVESPVFDRVRTCDNHCDFCFIYQLPKGMRKSLYMKDDDYRLSYLYGNFTTLTRFTESDVERVITENLSPLFVSIHATDHKVRAKMLNNESGAVSLVWLKELLKNGIDVHGQIVMCPGINDGEVFEDTLATILEEYWQLKSLAVVPIGVSRFNSSQNLKVHTKELALNILRQINEWQEIYSKVLKRKLVYPSDELFMLADREIPESSYYEAEEQIENGVGLTSAFRDAFFGDVTKIQDVRSGFFKWVDSAPNFQYRPQVLEYSSKVASKENTAILTGEYGAQIIKSLIACERLDGEKEGIIKVKFEDVKVVEVKNTYFGGNIKVAGLMTGFDISRALEEEREATRFLLPDVCLNEGRFIDDVSLSDLPKNVEVIKTNGHALREALQENEIKY